MELRLLRYFLTVAKEQSFTKAAEQLHITQPTLSRQMAAFEEDLGIILFIRNGKKISLTDEGILLKRRALEILNLEERTLEELKGKEEVVEGTITIGCGEFAAVETLAKICKTYKEKYPLVQIVLHTATADAVYEMMNKGLVDIALFMEPVDTEGLDYIRITDCDHWCVGMRPDDPLAEKEFIKKEDLIGKPLILPERMNVQSELANWFGKDFSKLQIAFTSNLGTNAGIMAAKKNAELIPLCHIIPLTNCEITYEMSKEESAVIAFCKTSCVGKTGVEMEALTGVSVALLTIYDMCKAMDRGMEISDIHLVEKSGGKSGHYIRQEK